MMISLLGKIAKFYKYVFEEIADERTKTYFLVESPFLMIAILFCYVYFVTNVGPRMMKKKRAFNLKSVMIVYNIFQIFINSFLFVEALRWGWGGRFNWLCEPVDWTVTPLNLYICRLCHLYFIIKLTDLLDTIFMVLRKRDDHISFLHVYHHAGMCALAWGGVKYLPGATTIRRSRYVFRFG
nr:elongation-very long chain-fatty acids-protein-4 [Kerria lacca]